jgi:hypothetical protein
MENAKKRRLDEDKRWDLKEKEEGCLVERNVDFGWKRELVGIDSCCVFLHYTIDYMMADFVLWLELGLIKGQC